MHTHLVLHLHESPQLSHDQFLYYDIIESDIIIYKKHQMVSQHCISCGIDPYSRYSVLNTKNAIIV